jgi:hypothetical protein
MLRGTVIIGKTPQGRTVGVFVETEVAIAEAYVMRDDNVILTMKVPSTHIKLFSDPPAKSIFPAQDELETANEILRNLRQQLGVAEGRNILEPANWTRYKK